MHPDTFAALSASSIVDVMSKHVSNLICIKPGIIHESDSLSITTFVSPVHPSNALQPTLVTLDGIVMLVNPSYPANAWSPIPVTGQPAISAGIIKLPTGAGSTATSFPFPIVAWPLSETT